MKNFNCMDLILVYISKKAVSMTETLEKISPCQITLLSTKYFLYFSIQFWTPDLGILEVHHAGLLTIENYFPHMTPRKKKKYFFPSSYVLAKQTFETEEIPHFNFES